MTATLPALDALVAARDALTAELAALPDAALAHGTLEAEVLAAAADELRTRLAIEATRDALGWQAPLAVRHLRSALAARRRVEARLAGLPPALLDREPAPGEWSVRRVLEHLIANDRRYSIQTRHAATRGDGDPLRPDDAVLPDRAPAAVLGEPLEVLIARLRTTQREAIAPLLSLDQTQLRRPTDWAGSRQSVAFRLDRFGQHVDEHAVDLDGTLAALGFVPGRAARLAAARHAQLGALEAALLGVPAAQRTATAPGESQSIEARLAELVDTDRRLLAAAREGVP